MAKLSSTTIFGDLDVSNELDVGEEIYEDDFRVATRNWVDGEISAAASSLSGLDSAVSNKLDASNYNPESDTHSRYSDSEARSAVDGSTLTNLNLSSTLTVPIANPGDSASEGEIAVSSDGTLLVAKDV